MGQYDKVQTKAQASRNAVVGVKDDQEAKAKPTSGAQADRMVISLTSGASHLSPLESLHDFGEQVVGSHDTAQIHAPWNLGDQAAVAQFSVSGEGFALTSTPSLTLPPSRSMSPSDLGNIERSSPTILFRPSHAGAHQGTLTITTAWYADGRTETQTIALRGRARELTQAPSHERSADDVAAEARRTREQADSDKAVAEDATKPDVYNAKFDKAVQLAVTGAGNLAMAQDSGLTIVDQETAAYQKLVEKAPRSIWWDIAEIALSIGTAGVAAHVAKNLLPRLLGTIEEVRLPAAAESIAIAGMKRVIPAKLAEFTTDSVKEGIKQAGKLAIKQVGPGADHDKGDLSGADSTFGHSTNSHIDFFAQQRNVLREQAHQNSVAMLDQASHLRPLLRSHPEEAAEVMSHVAESLNESAQMAEQEQANAVAPQWATFVARMSLGAEAVSSPKVGDKPQQATRTDALRPAKLNGAPNSANGVLDVYVENEYPPAKVSGARLHGVSQELADRLGAHPLGQAETPMPIRFVLGPRNAEPTIVTRDEVGRVRVQGNYSAVARYAPSTGHAAGEEDAIKGATAMVDQILAKALREWGVVIVSDDATGRG